MTHAEYLAEPATTIDWVLAFAGMEQDMQEDARKREQAKANAKARRH